MWQPSPGSLGPISPSLSPACPHHPSAPFIPVTYMRLSRNPDAGVFQWRLGPGVPNKPGSATHSVCSLKESSNMEKAKTGMYSEQLCCENEPREGHSNTHPIPRVPTRGLGLKREQEASITEIRVWSCPPLSHHFSWLQSMLQSQSRISDRRFPPQHEWHY